MLKHMEIALGELGVKEIAGKTHSKDVLKYFSEIGHSWVKDDETPWCAAFTNWVLKEANLKGSGKLNARSFLEVGKKVTSPKFGDIVVFWRGSKTGWQGHVAFYISQRGNYIYVVGGNQTDQVKVSAYSKDRLLGYRRLVEDSSKPATKDIKSFTNKELVTELLLRI